jgi:hypothetical protein
MCSGKGLMRTYWLVLPEEVYEYDQAHEAVAMPAVILAARAKASQHLPAVRFGAESQPSSKRSSLQVDGTKRRASSRASALLAFFRRPGKVDSKMSLSDLREEQLDSDEAADIPPCGSSIRHLTLNQALDDVLPPLVTPDSVCIPIQEDEEEELSDGECHAVRSIVNQKFDRPIRVTFL